MGVPMSFEAALKHYREVKADLDSLYRELPEGIDGLTSLYEEAEDYTCFTLRKLLGRRDKGDYRNAFL